MTPFYIQAVLRKTSTIIQEEIHSPHGGYNNSHKLDDSLDIERVGLLLAKYQYEVSKAIKEVERKR